jgi:glucosamine kinase
MKSLYIGVDGGGTKSKVCIVDENHLIVGIGVSGPSNIRLSTDIAWKSIHEGIAKALHNTGISLKDYHCHIGLGLAGIEVPADRMRFLSYSHSFETIVLESDAYAACLGAHDRKDGAIIIIGTGVNGFEVSQGEKIQVSGWGFPHDDLGGGAWIGLQAASLALQHHDGRLLPSPLLEAILAPYNGDFFEYVSFCNAAKSTEFATLAPLVTEYAEKKDPHAIAILKKAAQYIDAVNEALEKRSNSPCKPLPLCLFGGIVPFIQPYLGSAIHQRLVERNHDAAMGAVFMIEDAVKGKKL